MDLLSLCCLACLTEPTAAGAWRIEAGAAFAARARTDAVASGPGEGLRVESVRLGARAPLGPASARVGLEADLSQPDAIDWARTEAHVSVPLGAGFRATVGRFRLGPTAGLESSLRERCVRDAPLSAERFLGAEGLVDQGLKLSWRAPLADLPLELAVWASSGQGVQSFDPPAPDTAGEAFASAIYGVGLRLEPLVSFGLPITVGASYSSGANATGPDNRTDLFSLDLLGRHPLDGGLQLTWTLEWLHRRHSVPFALVAEGGLSFQLALGGSGWHAATRYDLFGAPLAPLRPALAEPGASVEDPGLDVASPPTEATERLHRVTFEGGLEVIPGIAVRASYAVRTDATEAVHEGALILDFALSHAAGRAPRDEQMADEPRKSPLASLLEAERALADGAALRSIFAAVEAARLALHRPTGGLVAGAPERLRDAALVLERAIALSRSPELVDLDLARAAVEAARRLVVRASPARPPPRREGAAEPSRLAPRPQTPAERPAPPPAPVGPAPAPPPPAGDTPNPPAEQAAPPPPAGDTPKPPAEQPAPPPPAGDAPKPPAEQPAPPSPTKEAPKPPDAEATPTPPGA